MNIFFNLISIFSFVGVGYLIFLFYKKENQNNQPKAISRTDNTKIKITRFNPFNEVGGNQSFIICILDQSNSGCVITSLHNKENTRIYAKEIIDGKTADKGLLSKEEKECLQKTINNS